MHKKLNTVKTSHKVQADLTIYFIVEFISTLNEKIIYFSHFPFLQFTLFYIKK